MPLEQQARTHRRRRARVVGGNCRPPDPGQQSGRDDERRVGHHEVSTALAGDRLEQRPLPELPGQVRPAQPSWPPGEVPVHSGQSPQRGRCAATDAATGRRSRFRCPGRWQQAHGWSPGPDSARRRRCQARDPRPVARGARRYRSPRRPTTPDPSPLRAWISSLARSIVNVCA